MITRRLCDLSAPVVTAWREGQRCWGRRCGRLVGRAGVWVLLATGAVMTVPVTTQAAVEAAASDPPRAQALPALGESASEGLSAPQERQLGDDIMRQIRQDPDYLDDPITLTYVQGLWQRLLEAARARGHIAPDQAAHDAWEVFVVKDRAVNAFALPGGFVGVHLGLIALTTHPDELAAVLAHELSHVTQRHIARRFGVSSQATLVGLTSIVLGVLAASRNPTAANALITGGQAAAIQGQLNFSRDMEREADRVGFGVLTDSGFGSAAMASMFEKMDRAGRFDDDQSFPYLRTHPLTSDRIAEARSRMGDRSGLGQVALEYAVIRGRAQVLMDPRVQSLHRWARDLGAQQASPAQRLMQTTASAIAAARLRQHARADEALAQAKALAKADAPAQRALQRMEIEMALERGLTARAQQAWKALADAAPAESGRSRGARTDLWLQARVALAGKDRESWQQAAESVQSWVAAQSADALMWSMLAQLAQRLEQPLRSARAEAEARWANGDIVGAVDRLRGAQTQARTLQTQPASTAVAMDAAVIDVRLREAEHVRNNLVREGRLPAGR